MSALSPAHEHKLPVRRFTTRQEMGQAAAADVADFLRARIRARGQARVIFAAADSQRDMLGSLIADQSLDWSGVTGFHMDEYIGLAPGSPQRLGSWLRREFTDRVKMGAFHWISPELGIPAAIAEYERLLAAGPIDAVCLGIGVNGHLAFNEPHVADFEDKVWVKTLELDPVSHQQQVDEGNFPSVAAMPKTAITLTVPCLLSGERLFCVVPGRAKRPALARALHGPISTECPATALRLHPRCTVYTDFEALPDPT